MTGLEIVLFNGVTCWLLENDELQIKIANEIKRKGLSVREVENLVKKLKETQGESPKKEKTTDPELESIIGEMMKKLGTKINIKDNNNKGKIEIGYDADSLKAIPEAVEKLPECCKPNNPFHKKKEDH